MIRNVKATEIQMHVTEVIIEVQITTEVLIHLTEVLIHLKEV